MSQFTESFISFLHTSQTDDVVAAIFIWVMLSICLPLRLAILGNLALLTLIIQS